MQSYVLFFSRVVYSFYFNRVEIHDSYKFVSKSYHSMKFHFRSIDTWLAGECQRLVLYSSICSTCGDSRWLVIVQPL